MKPLITSRFTYARGGLLIGLARLYPDRIALYGIRWWGWPHRRILRLRDLADARWISNTEGHTNLVLYLTSGKRLYLRIRGAGIWKYEIDEWMKEASDRFGIGPGESYSTATLSVVPLDPKT